MNVGIRVGKAASTHSRYAFALPALVILVGYLVYHGWQFCGFIRDTRQAITGATDKESMLQAARSATRVFLFSVTGIAVALWIVVLVLT